MQRLRIKYSKEEPLKYISHLDLIRLWERTIRRANLPAAYSQGFNPKAQISFGPPLALGYTSQAEYLDLNLEKWENPEQVKEALAQKVPSGIKILEIKTIPPHGPSLVTEINRAEYLVGLESEINPSQIMQDREIIITKKKKDGNEKKVDIRPLIYEFSPLGSNTFKMVLACGTAATLRPEDVIKTFGDIKIHKIHRTNLSK